VGAGAHHAAQAAAALLLHCCCTAAALLLHCCCTAAALLLHCCCIAAALLPCGRIVLLLLHGCLLLSLPLSYLRVCLRLRLLSAAIAVAPAVSCFVVAAQAAAALLLHCCHGRIVLLLLHGCLLLSLPLSYLRVCLRLRLLSAAVPVAAAVVVAAAPGRNMSSWHRAALLLLLDAGGGTLVADGRVPAAAHGPLGHQGGADRLALGASAALVDRAGGPRCDRRAASRGAAGGAPKLPSYTVTPTSGFLAPGEVASMAVTFHAREPGACAKMLNIKITDAQSLLGVVDTLPVALTAARRTVPHQSQGRMAGRSDRYPRGARVHGPRLWLVQGGRHPNVLARAHQRGQVSGGLQFPVLKSKMMRNILKIEREVQSRRRRRRRRERRRRRRASHRRQQAAHHASRSW
jgi:hypothetical protein